MKFHSVLDNSRSREITRKEALFLLEETKTHKDLLELFRVASEVRRREVGDVFKFDGFIGPSVPAPLLLHVDTVEEALGRTRFGTY